MHELGMDYTKKNWFGQPELSVDIDDNNRGHNDYRKISIPRTKEKEHRRFT